MTAKPPSATGASILGVVFDAEPLGAERARFRAWQMWMERLDPAELRSAALYDGALFLQGNHQIVVIAISGAPQVLAYVRDAFAAPDLVAFTGIAPISHRFIDEQTLPRERLTLRGYVTAERAFAPQQDEPHLLAIARHAEWAIAAPVPASDPAPARPVPLSPEQMARQETVALQATKLEGATQVMLRLWRVSAPARRPLGGGRRLFFGLLGTGLILLALGLIVFHYVAQSQAHGRSPHSDAPALPAPDALTVAPLALRIPCQPGSAAQFTIGNEGDAPLPWSSDGAKLAPLVALSLNSGAIAAGEAQIVIVTTTEYVTAPHVETLNITAAKEHARVTVTYGGCSKNGNGAQP